MTDNAAYSSLEAALHGLISGGATYGTLGAGGALLSGANPRGVLKAAILGSVLGGGAAGGSQLAGAAIKGPAKRSESTPYVTRGLIGGASVGTGLGALLGALAATGKIPRLPKWLPSIVSNGAKAVKRELPIENLVTDAIKGSSGVKGALLGGGLGGTLGAYTGWDEGLVLDSVEKQLRDYERHKKWM